MLRFKIKTKILLIMLTITLIPLLIFSQIQFMNMNRLGNNAVRNIETLGGDAVEKSTKTLENQTRQYLIHMVSDQASISNTIFEKVSTEINIMESFATSAWSNPSHFVSRPSYSFINQPASVFDASAYHLAPNVSLDSVETELDLSSGMDEIFIPIIANDENISSVYIGTESGIYRIYPWFSSPELTGYDPRERVWYQHAVETGETGWTDLYIDAFGHGLCVTCFKPYFDRDGKLAGVVAADVTLEALNERIINTQVGKAGYAFLIDKTGKIIARPGLTTNDMRWDQSFETENLLESDNEALSDIINDMIHGGTGFSRCTFDDEDKFIAYAPVQTTNWSIGMVLPVNEMLEPVQTTRDQIVTATEYTNSQTKNLLTTQQRLFYIALLIMILAITLIALPLASTITRPILELDKGAHIVGGGNLDYRLSVNTGDEIEELADAFNKMTDDLKEYIHNLKETTAEKERIESELKIAHEIQSSMLPRIFPPFPDREEFEIFALMEPAKEVGGDFFDFFLVTENKLCFLLGDVSGKGVPAALFMMITKTLLKNEALQGVPPNEVLQRVNNIIAIDNDTSMFATIFCGVLNTQTGEVEFANAGHNAPLLCSTDHRAELLAVERDFVLGPVQDMKYRLQKITLHPRDILFVYTDGITEAMNPSKELFSENRLQTALCSLSNDTVESIIGNIRQDVYRFAQGEPQSDDITMMALKYFG